MSEGQQGGHRGTVCAEVLKPGLRDVWGQVEKAKGEGVDHVRPLGTL